MNSKALALAGVVLVAGAVYFLTRGPARTGEAVGQPPAAVLEPEQPKETRSLGAGELASAPEVARIERTAAPSDSGKSEPARSKDAPLTISGRLVDEGGAPVPDAKVMVATAGPGPEFALDELGDLGGMGAFMALETVQSSSDGRFEVPLGRKANSVQLAARHQGSAPLDQRFDVKPGRNDLGDIKLASGAFLAGRVVDSRGAGVPGVEVHRKRVGNDMFASFSPFAGPVVAVSDERGAFQIDQLAIGDYKLSFTHPEHPDALHEGSTAAGSERQTNIEVRLEDGYPVQGLVTGIEGKWTDDLQVSASKGGGAFGMPDLGGGRRGKVEQDGSFRIGGLSRETTYKLAVVRGDKNDMRQMMRGRGAGGVEAKGGDRGVRVPFQSETAIEGQVVDARTKAPVTSFRVEAGAQWKVPLTDEKGKPQTSFPDGRFRFTNLMRMNKDAKIGLVVVADGYRSLEKKGIVAKDGETTQIGMIELEAAPMARVTVVDAGTAKPIANAKVTLEPAGDEGERAVAFAVGGSDDEDLPFMPAGSARSAKTAKDGVALVAMEPGKRLRPKVQAKGYAPWQGDEFTAPADGEQAIGAGLVEGGLVLVKVVDSAGKPVPKQVVELDSDAAEMPWMNGQPKTDAKGEVEFKNLVPGPQRFRIGGGGGGGLFGGGRVRMRASRAAADGEGMSFDLGGGDEMPWSTVQVADKGRHELVLTVPVRASITGVVRERGRPVAGVSVRADEDGGLVFMGFGGGDGAKTDASGRFTLEDVKTGTTKLVVTGPGRAMSHTQTVEVAEGENSVDIDLPSCSVEGRVTNDQGAPVVGAKVRAILAKGQDDAASGSVAMVMAIDSGEADGQVMEFGGGENASTTTDADGRYMLRGLRAGKKLQVEVRAKEARPKRSDEFELGMDEAKTGLDLVVLPGASLEVALRRADGKDAMFFARAVRIDDKGEETTDTAQQFAQKAKTKLTGLAPGRWKVTVNPVNADQDGSGAAPQELEPKTVEVRSGQKNEVVFDL